MAKTKRAKTNDYSYVPIEIIVDAIRNDERALEYILERYQSYIEILSSYKIKDRNGRWFTVLDEDKKQQIQEVLILAIRRFEIK